jgi:hypothetical protein
MRFIAPSKEKSIVKFLGQLVRMCDNIALLNPTYRIGHIVAFFSYHTIGADLAPHFRSCYTLIHILSIFLV